MALQPDTVKESMTLLRSHVGQLARQVKQSADEIKVLALPFPAPDSGPQPDRGEMIANAMLAYRHLEDARMRLGKVIQAFEGGVSCYDAQT